jgi:CRISPR-associated protein Csm2
VDICFFWTDADKKKIDPKLYSDIAEKMAKDLRADYDGDKKKKVNKPTQIRKFYDEVQRLNIEANKLGFKSAEGQEKRDAVLPMIHMLTAKAVYARGRELVSENFVKFIKDAVNCVKEPEDLSVFANYFEAFMGFYKFYGPKN